MTGAARHRPGGPDDAVVGVTPSSVHLPASVEEAAATLVALAAEGARVAVVGGGTELSLGAAPRGLDAVVSTSAMGRILDYAPADMVLTAEAGVTLAALQATAAAHRQRLALDPPDADRATVGGLVATGAAGPLRARYGAIRDLIIGATLVRGDGVIAHGGGKVVKNVAGFDLPKLACGSLGTLAMIGSATFRLHPLPEATATVRLAPMEAGAIGRLLARAREAQLEPAASWALRRPGGYQLVVVFEGFGAGVQRQSDRLQKLAREAGPSADVVGEADAAALRAEHDLARRSGALRLKLAVLPSRFAEVEGLLAPALSLLGGGRVVFYPSVGLGYVAAEVADPVGAAEAVRGLRRALSPGTLVVEAAPATVRAGVDCWGDPPPGFAVMRRLKERFDPEGRLNPGRFVGGL